METSPESSSVPTLLPHLWKSTLASGILSLILGIVVLAWPGISVLIAAVAFGIYLVTTGFAQVVFAFSLHVSAGSRILLFVSGAASLILAVLAFRHFGQGYAVLLLAIWVGIGFVFRGVATSRFGHQRSDPARPRLVDFRGRDQPNRRHRGDGFAIRIDRHAGARRRHLVRGHRRVRNRFRIRHLQRIEETPRRTLQRVAAAESAYYTMS